MEIDLPENELPDGLHEIVRQAVDRHADIGDAQKEVLANAKSLPEYEAFRETLVERALCRMVADARHNRTREIKRAAGQYGKGSALAKPSDQVRECYESLYFLSVAGTTLGMLLGEQIPEAANTERRIGNGHLANAVLLDKLRPLVPEGKRVREVVSEKRLKTLWRQSRGQAFGEAA